MDGPLCLLAAGMQDGSEKRPIHPNRLRDSNLPTDVAKMALSLIAIPSTSFNGMFNVRAC
jgi:hypothetical protein